MHTASFAFLGAVVLALAAGCAPVDTLDAAPALAAQDDDSTFEETSDIIKLQAPPVKLLIVNEYASQVAMIGTNTAIGDVYAGRTEYWFGGQSAAPSGRLVIEASPIDGATASSIAAFVRPLAEAFATPRVVSESAWVRGPLSFQADQTPYLYWTTHPDNPREILGLVLVADDAGRLSTAGWYRSMPPDSSGRAFTSQSWSQPLTPVLDAKGLPSADPNLIREGDWYGIAMTPQ